MPKVVVVTVIATVESSVGVQELKDFVDDALSTWGGQRHPDDHLFNSMDIKRVNVTHIGNIKP